MKAKIENLEKDRLVEMIKILYVESQFNFIDEIYPENDYDKRQAIEKMTLEIALILDERILRYFGEDVERDFEDEI